MNVEPGGTVDVVYYESQETTASNPVCTISVGGGLRRQGTANSLVNVIWAQSLDGGKTLLVVGRYAGWKVSALLASSVWVIAFLGGLVLH